MGVREQRGKKMSDGRRKEDEQIAVHGKKPMHAMPMNIQNDAKKQKTPSQCA